MNTITCENCDIQNCTKLCKVHTANAFYNYINNIDTVPTRIGEISYDKNNRPEYISNGIITYEKGQVSWLFSSLKATSLAVGDKFLNIDNKNTFQLMKEYCKLTKKSDEETEEITSKVRDINLNKLIITPFKPTVECEVKVENEDGINTDIINTPIINVKWRNNDETHKLDQIITFEAKYPKTNEHIKKFAHEYMTEFTISKLNIQARSNVQSNKLIRITDNGIIKPIVITHNNSSVAIDGTYVYLIDKDKEDIIGYWDANDNLVILSHKNTETVKFLEKYTNIIKCHNRYIAPYHLYETNVVKI